jgi:hypothetical protein
MKRIQNSDLGRMRAQERERLVVNGKKKSTNETGRVPVFNGGI